MVDTPALLGGTPVVAKGAHTLWPIVTEDEKRAVLRVLDRGVLSGSYAPEARALEEEFAAYVKARHAILTHCGTSALQLALGAAGVRAGDEVIVPAYSFVATPLAVLLQGAVPIFVDVDLLTGIMDSSAVEAAITPKTRAIMPVHIHGLAADMATLTALAQKHGLLVVEDAAQAHGATFRGTPVGAIGRAGGFSLQSSKNFSAGEGGIFVTNDRAIAEEANRLRNFGQDLLLDDASSFDPTHPLDGHRALDSLGMGSMYRGNEMMAAFAREQLKKLPERTAAGQRNAERLARALSDLPGVTPPLTPPERTSVHHKYRVHLDPVRAGVPLTPKGLRDVMIRALRAEGLEVVLWQDRPLPEQTIFQRRIGYGDGWPFAQAPAARLALNYDPSRYPVTRRLLDGSLLLFSQSYPLIGQGEAVVDQYAEAFQKVWHHREAIASHAISAGWVSEAKSPTARSAAVRS